MKLRHIALAIAALGISAQAAANTDAPSFDYVGGGFVSAKFDDETLNGFGADFSRSLGNELFVMGNVAFAEDTFNIGGSDAKIELTTMSANLGYKFYQTNSAAAYAFAGLVYGEAKARVTGIGSESIDDTGYAVGLGYRNRVTEQFEFDGRVEFVDLMDESDVQFSLRGNYYLSEKWSLNAGYSFVDSDSSTLLFGVSYHF